MNDSYAYYVEKQAHGLESEPFEPRGPEYRFGNWAWWPDQNTAMSPDGLRVVITDENLRRALDAATRLMAGFSRSGAQECGIYLDRATKTLDRSTPARDFVRILVRWLGGQWNQNSRQMTPEQVAQAANLDPNKLVLPGNLPHQKGIWSAVTDSAGETAGAAADGLSKALGMVVPPWAVVALVAVVVYKLVK